MISKLISIGNSRGVRLPKKFIENWPLDQKVFITKSGDNIIITLNNKNLRENWEDQIKLELEKNSNDWDIDETFLSVENEFDSTEWQWD